MASSSSSSKEQVTSVRPIIFPSSYKVCVISIPAIRGNDRLRGMAWGIVGCTPGVDSVKITGENKDKLQIVGDVIVDWAELTLRLGEVGSARIESTTTTNCAIM